MAVFLWSHITTTWVQASKETSALPADHHCLSPYLSLGRWKIISRFFRLSKKFHGLRQSPYIAAISSLTLFVCLIQQAIVKLRPPRFIRGTLAYELDWLKVIALLLGHRPLVKDGEPDKLELKQKSVKFMRSFRDRRTILIYGKNYFTCVPDLSHH